jgi:hypothetical protein
MYAQIREGLGAERPKGLIAHIVIEKADGLLRYVDVWESEGDWGTFVEERLHPVVEGIFRKMGFNPGGEPASEEITVIDAWVPEGAPRIPA